MRRHGRARVNARAPQAFAICDRCSFLVNHVDLRWQMQWAGPKLQNLRLLVCRTCLDVPQENLRTIVIPPDPLPIRDPRPQMAPIGRGGDFSQSEFSTDDFATGWGGEPVPPPTPPTPPVPPVPPIPPVPPVSEGIYDEDIYDEGIY